LKYILSLHKQEHTSIVVSNKYYSRIEEAYAFINSCTFHRYDLSHIRSFDWKRLIHVSI